jgi:hypothetical protein
MNHSQQLDLFYPDRLPVQSSTVVKSSVSSQAVQSKPSLTLIPSASMHPGQINIYKQILWEPHRLSRLKDTNLTGSHGHVFQHLLESGRTADGKVSAIARRKMLKALKYLLLLANQKTIHNQFSGRLFKFRIAFVTLTLPSQQIHSDNEIKSQLLNQLLIELRKYYRVRNYIWRAEKQRNGNLHFHILVDRFIPFQELRDRWNRICNKLGYVDRYRADQESFHSNGFRIRDQLLKTWPARKQKEAYFRGVKCHWNSPNSTDIHSVTKIHNVQQYISKYLTKNEIQKLSLENDKIDLMVQKGRIWGCSTSLSNVKGAKFELDNELQDEVHELSKSEGVRIVKDTYFQIIYFDISLIANKPGSRLFALFCQFLIDKFDFNYQQELQSKS